MSARTTPARESDLSWIAPAATSARLVEGADELREIHETQPWRVRVTSRGEACLLTRWREHLDYLAMAGLWCAAARVPPLVADMEGVAREQGFGRLLGPLVPEECLPPYLAAGLEVCERVVVLRLELRNTGHPVVDAPFDVTLRRASPADLEEVMDVDAASFDDFWRYDAASLRRYARAERMTVAQRNGHVIGYTLSAVRGGEGTLGRLAVAETERGRGVGRTLACGAVTWMAGEGARSVTLSTQEHNTASRGLYGSLGFRELRGALAATISAPLGGPEQGV